MGCNCFVVGWFVSQDQDSKKTLKNMFSFLLQDGCSLSMQRVEREQQRSMLKKQRRSLRLWTEMTMLTSSNALKQL